MYECIRNFRMFQIVILLNHVVTKCHRRLRNWLSSAALTQNIENACATCLDSLLGALLLDRLDAFPSAAQLLLPQTDPVVASTHC